MSEAVSAYNGKTTCSIRGRCLASNKSFAARRVDQTLEFAEMHLGRLVPCLASERVECESQTPLCPRTCPSWGWQQFMAIL